MKLQDFLVEEQLLEGLKKFKLSTRLEKLLDKVKNKFISLPGKEKTDAEQVIEMLDNEILPKVKKIEKKYADGSMSRYEAVREMKRLKPKVASIKKILKADKILPDRDWMGIISFLMWIPLAVAGRSLVDLIKPGD